MAAADPKDVEVDDEVTNDVLDESPLVELEVFFLDSFYWKKTPTIVLEVHIKSGYEYALIKKDAYNFGT